MFCDYISLSLARHALTWNSPSLSFKDSTNRGHGEPEECGLHGTVGEVQGPECRLGPFVWQSWRGNWPLPLSLGETSVTLEKNVDSDLLLADFITSISPEGMRNVISPRNPALSQ